MLPGPRLPAPLGIVVGMPAVARASLFRAWLACAVAVVLLATALTPTVHADGGDTAVLVSPVGGVRVVRLFDPPPQPWHAGHRGIDLAASVGAPVLSPGAGVVTFAGDVVDRGVVTITHPQGLRSSLEPVRASVEVGDSVGAGQQIGVVEDGQGHCGGRTCVHWGVRDGARYLNPLDWLAGFGRVRLLPVRRAPTGRRPSS